MNHTREILLKAADLIEDLGWTQGRYWDSHGRHCAVGAITAVTQGADPEPAIAAVARHVGMPSVVSWNDMEGRTDEEVVAVLRATATEVAD